MSSTTRNDAAAVIPGQGSEATAAPNPAAPLDGPASLSFRTVGRDDGSDGALASVAGGGLTKAAAGTI